MLARWECQLDSGIDNFLARHQAKGFGGFKRSLGKDTETVVLTVFVLFPFALDFILASIFDATENFFVEIDHSCLSVQHRYYQQAKWLQHTSPS